MGRLLDLRAPRACAAKRRTHQREICGGSFISEPCPGTPFSWRWTIWGAEATRILIREVPKGPNPEATSWTLALMVEEIVLPYMESTRELAPLGAGLAIIEPPAVGGGTVAPEATKKKRYPQFHSAEVGLALNILGAVNHKAAGLLLGPHIGIHGLLGPRFMGSFSVTWVGNGRFRHGESELSGTVSHMPISLLLGYMPLQHRIVSMTISAGISTGFTVFQTSTPLSKGQRTDVFFDPWLQAMVHTVFTIYDPLAFYLDVGANFPVVKDVLENAGEKVYYQDWLMPFLGVGLQLWL